MSWIRHTSVVLAGVTSVTLTGAAASVILSALGAGLPTDNIFDFAAPPVTRAAEPAAVEPSLAAPVLTAHVTRNENAVVSEYALENGVTVTITQSDGPGALAATVKVDDYYVDATVAKVRTKVVGVDLATNIFDLIPDFIKQWYDLDPDIDGPTVIHSENDLRRGEMTVTASDPEIGEHTLDIQRRNAAAEVAPAETAPQQPEVDGA